MFYYILITFILFVQINLFNVNGILQTVTNSKNDESYQNIQIKEENGYDLLEKWTNEAYSSLIATLANERLKNVNENSKHLFGECTKTANTVPKHAKCLSQLIIQQQNKTTNQHNNNNKIKERNNIIDSVELPHHAYLKSLLHSQDSNKQSNKINKKITKNKKEKRKNRLQQKNNKFKFFNKNFEQQAQIKQSQKLIIFNKIKTSNRLQRYGHNNNSKNKKKLIKVGEFRLMKDLPLEADLPSQNKNLKKKTFKIKNNKIIVHQQNNYSLLLSKKALSPIGGVAKMLMKILMKSKNKTISKPWQETVDTIQRYQIKKIKLKKKNENFDLNLSKQNFNEKIFRKDRLLKNDADYDIQEFNRDQINTLKMKAQQENGADKRLIQLLRDALKIGYTLAGKNTTNFDKKNLRVVSPRFLSISPNEESMNEDGIQRKLTKNDTIEFLSPSLFSLQTENNDDDPLENLLSLPSLMKNFTNTIGDQEEWINLILETSGITDQAEIINEMKNMTTELSELDKLTKERFNPTSGRLTNEIAQTNIESKMRSSNGKPLYLVKENVTQIFGDFENRKIDTFQALLETFSKEQIKELNTTGYTTLTKSQILYIYGPNSPYNCSDAIQRLSTRSKAEILNEMENDIHKTAAVSDFKLKRQRDIVLSPILLTPLVNQPKVASQPIILSPVVLSPLVLSPALLGPVVLSPWIFVPLILSARVLSPLILSPFALSPVILTPIVLHPIILSPGIFIPVVLSPFVLSPFILTPLAFAPIILSPIVLSPVILSPMLASPLILSPFVLSPIILSPQILSALVLSPYALSPIVASPLIAFSVVLSPSWLS